MNCENCGAPLELAEGRMVLTCHFCQSTTRLVDPLDDGDRIISLDRPAGIGCPCCRLELLEAAVDGKQARFCPECLGILVDGPTFAEVVRTRRASYRGRELPVSPMAEESFQRAMECPRCQSPMETHHHSGAGRAVIDTCDHCHLVWLDHFELTSLERTPGNRSH